MSRRVRTRGTYVLRALFALCLVLLVVAPASSASPPGGSPFETAGKSPFCEKLGSKVQASSGAQMYCFGPQSNGPGTPDRVRSPLTLHPAASSRIRNVDAASPSEDVSPSGVQAYGQSEVSTAAVGPYVVEAWNDSTGFFSPCPSPRYKEELTGYGFSNDGGRTFRDLGGLPNDNCESYMYSGDPSVGGWSAGGKPYFYVSSLYLPTGFGSTIVYYIALSACQVVGSGTSARLRCGLPVIVAQSTECLTFKPSNFKFCSFLDKDFLTLDPVHGRLYVSYTDFGFSPMSSAGKVELAVCDIGTHVGGRGPAGGTPANPVCRQPHGAPPTPPYYLVTPGSSLGCENEGAYPAVDTRTGDVYVAYEYNWATNVFAGGSSCSGQPTQIRTVRVPFYCLPLRSTSPCGPPTNVAAARVVSMDAAFIPGYNRFPMNDFPRIAASPLKGTVSVVWNDARLHPTGDILLQSYELGSLTRVQSSPVVLNSVSGDRAWRFLPALRSSDDRGNLSVSWYDRRLSPSSAYTDVYAAVGVSPRTTARPRANVRITNVSSNWNANSSVIIPNFGDYTDSYVAPTSSTSTAGRLYVAWSDGRLGEPQPFNASVPIR